MKLLDLYSFARQRALEFLLLVVVGGDFYTIGVRLLAGEYIADRLGMLGMDVALLVFVILRLRGVKS